MTIREMKRQLLTEALTRYRGDTRMAAIALGVSRKTVYNMVSQYGLRVTQFQVLPEPVLAGHHPEGQ